VKLLIESDSDKLQGRRDSSKLPDRNLIN